MAAASNANSSLFGDNLKNNETVVLQLQTQLNELGFNAGLTDGVWVEGLQVLLMLLPNVSRP